MIPAELASPVPAAGGASLGDRLRLDDSPRHAILVNGHGSTSAIGSANWRYWKSRCPSLANSALASGRIGNSLFPNPRLNLTSIG